jgi:hypothetical protein
VSLFAAGDSPRELLIDDGRVWFSSWESGDLRILNPQTGSVAIAPGENSDPRSLFLGADDTVWTTDGTAGAVVGFRPNGRVIRVPVGPNPGDIAFLDGRLTVAVGSGEVVVIEGQKVVGKVSLGPGLGAMATITVPRQVGALSPADIYKHPAVEEWALGPCAWAVSLGLRVLCPGSNSTLDRTKSGRGDTWRRRSEGPGYETGCPVTDLPYGSTSMGIWLAELLVVTGAPEGWPLQRENIVDTGTALQMTPPGYQGRLDVYTVSLKSLRIQRMTRVNTWSLPEP